MFTYFRNLFLVLLLAAAGELYADEGAYVFTNPDPYFTVTVAASSVVDNPEATQTYPYFWFPNGTMSFLPTSSGSGWYLYQPGWFSTRIRNYRPGYAPGGGPNSWTADFFPIDSYTHWFHPDYSYNSGTGNITKSGVDGAYDEDGAQLMSVHRLNGNNLIGFFQGDEKKWLVSHGSHSLWKVIAVSTSSDDGANFNKVGIIIEANESPTSFPQDGGAGEFSVIYDSNQSRWVCFYQEKDQFGDGKIHMAMSEDADASPGTWKKWTTAGGGSWTTDATSSSVGHPVPSLSGYAGANPAVHWNYYLQRYVMVYQNWANQILLTTSTNLFDWTTPQVFIDTVGGSQERFATVIGDDYSVFADKDAKIGYAHNTTGREFKIRDISFETPTITVSDSQETEGDVHTFTVTLDRLPTAEATVQYYMSNGSATNGSDYTAYSGTLTFAIGESNKTISVTNTDDSDVETNENFYLIFHSPHSSRIGDFSAEGIILDNDNVFPKVNVADYTFGESEGTVQAMIELSLEYSSQVIVEYTFSNGTAVNPADHTSTNGILTFAAGETNKAVIIEIVDEMLYESNEVFYLYLSGAVNSEIQDGVAVITITNDDLQVPHISSADNIYSENAGTVQAEVVLNRVYNADVTVAYTFSNGTAVNPADHTSTNGILTFTPGDTSEMVTIELVDNMAWGGSKVFYLYLSAAVNGIISDNMAVVTITNDDPKLPPFITETNISTAGINYISNSITFEGINTNTGVVAGTPEPWLMVQGSRYNISSETNWNYSLNIASVNEGQNVDFTFYTSNNEGSISFVNYVYHIDKYPPSLSIDSHANGIVYGTAVLSGISGDGAGSGVNSLTLFISNTATGELETKNVNVADRWFYNLDTSSMDNYVTYAVWIEGSDFSGKTAIVPPVFLEVINIEFNPVAGANPNPGDVVKIQGLSWDSAVKIFTVKGSVIGSYENMADVFANGRIGEISWDTRNYYGDLVSSGIYIIKIKENKNVPASSEKIIKLSIVRR